MSITFKLQNNTAGLKQPVQYLHTWLASFASWDYRVSSLQIPMFFMAISHIVCENCPTITCISSKQYNVLTVVIRRNCEKLVIWRSFKIHFV
jgi:hypothetical protein